MPGERVGLGRRLHGERVGLGRRLHEGHQGRQAGGFSPAGPPVMGQPVSPPPGAFTELTIPVHADNSNSIYDNNEVRADDDLLPVEEAPEAERVADEEDASHGVEAASAATASAEPQIVPGIIVDGAESEEEEALEEALAPRLAREPSQPSAAERRLHELTHLPFRSWCRCCVDGRMDGLPHAASVGGPHRVPAFLMDYCTVRKASSPAPHHGPTDQGSGFQNTHGQWGAMQGALPRG